MSIPIDMDYVTQTIRKEWNGWNPRQRTSWTMWHDLPISQTEFDNLDGKIQDALLVEYLDNAKKNYD